MDRKRIVVIGAGIAGWGVVRALERAARLEDIDVTLIDRRPHHEFPPLLYEVATGKAQGRAEDCEQILASGVCVNLNSYERVLARNHIRFLWDEAVAIDRRTRRVQLRTQGMVPYDALVLALGCETATYGIPGLREHAIPLKSVHDALRIRRNILDLVARVRKGSPEPARMVIGGGGATGVEFASELGSFLASLVVSGDIRREDYELSIVESNARLLPGFPPTASQEALRRLHRFGVRVFLDALVHAVALGSVTIVPRALHDGEQREHLLCGFDGDSYRIVVDCVVWTGGIAYPILPKDAGFAVDARNRVLVDEHSMIQGERCVFAVGDCAAFVPRGAKYPLPPLASIAVRQAPVVARNAVSCILDEPLRVFRHRVMPAIIPLGGRYAAFVYRAWTWCGGFPWYLHLLVTLRYYVGAFGMARGARIWWRGARIYVQND